MEKFFLYYSEKYLVLQCYNIPFYNIERTGQYIGIPKETEVSFMDTIAQILSIIGCINWGLIGLFQFDLVAWLFGGQGSLFSRVIYTVVGLAGLWCLTFLFRKDMLMADK